MAKALQGRSEAANPTPTPALNQDIGRIRAHYIWLTVLTAALTCSLVWALTAYYCERLHEEGRVRVAALAATIAAGMPAEGIRALGSREDLKGPESLTLLSSLVAARQANPDVRRIFVLILGGSPRAWRVALDAVSSPGEQIRPGGTYDAAAHPQVGRAVSGPTSDHAPYRDARGSWLGGYAPIRGPDGRAVAVLAVEVGADKALLSERRFRLEATIVCLLLLGGIMFTGYDRYQKRRLELDRNRNIHARLSIHRLAEVMTRAGGESDLIRGALDAMAEATGFPDWALFRRERETEPFTLTATRGLSDGTRRDLDPDATGPDVCSVPLLERGVPKGILQCFSSAARGFGANDVTLIRWLASQLAQGLKRIQLESRDQLLASYMRSTDEMLIGFDLEGRITYANPATRNALGDSSDGELRGRAIDATFLPPGSENSTTLLELLHREGGFSGELVCCTVSGGRFPAEATVSKTLDREGNEGAWVLVGRDISERREREEEIQSRSEQLELINDQLQQANEKLAEGSRMKNEFLANTSHELRTPLNAVIGFATLLEQGVTDSEEERKSFARSIRESAEHLLVVINDILDLAKVEAGRFEVALEAGDATPTILAAVDTLVPVALRKGIQLTAEAPASPLEMQLDPARLRQVLLNLLGNAIKFTDKGDVSIRAWRQESPAEIRILVKDTGIGIAKEDQGRLFVKFSQVDASYKRRHQGAGLGLVITKSLVQRMGGRIAMESDGVGLGTRVMLSFPVASNEPDPDQRGMHATTNHDR
jgi:PAS domain S-box-containing protein